MHVQPNFGVAISQSHQWNIWPSEISQPCVHVGSERYHVLSTRGGGACGLHALWGRPEPSGEASGIELGQANVRRRVVSSLPKCWSDVCRVRDGVLQPILQRLVDQLWKDLLYQTSARVWEKISEARSFFISIEETGSSYIMCFALYWLRHGQCSSEHIVPTSEEMLPGRFILVVSKMLLRKKRRNIRRGYEDTQCFSWSCETIVYSTH